MGLLLTWVAPWIDYLERPFALSKGALGGAVLSDAGQGLAVLERGGDGNLRSYCWAGEKVGLAADGRYWLADMGQSRWLVRPVTGAWVRAFLDELDGFPSERVPDDQADAVSGAHQMLAGKRRLQFL